MKTNTIFHAMVLVISAGIIAIAAAAYHYNLTSYALKLVGIAAPLIIFDVLQIRVDNKINNKLNK